MTIKTATKAEIHAPRVELNEIVETTYQTADSTRAMAQRLAAAFHQAAEFAEEMLVVGNRLVGANQIASALGYTDGIERDAAIMGAMHARNGKEILCDDDFVITQII